MHRRSGRIFPETDWDRESSRRGGPKNGNFRVDVPPLEGFGSGNSKLTRLLRLQGKSPNGLRVSALRPYPILFSNGVGLRFVTKKILENRGRTSFEKILEEE